VSSEFTTLVSGLNFGEHYKVDMPPYCDVDMPPYCEVDMPPYCEVDRPPPCEVLKLRGHVLRFSIIGLDKEHPS